MDIKLEIAELTAGYLGTKSRLKSIGPAGVDEYANLVLRPDLDILSSADVPPELREEAMRRVVVTGLFEEELFCNFPSLRPKNKVE